VRKVLAAVDDRIDKDALLRSLGLDPGRPVDPARMIPDTDYYGFLEELTGLDPDPVTIPLRAGAAMRCDDYGAFGLAWKSAPDLGGSYARAERYARVLTNVATYEVERVEKGAFMHLHRDGPRRLGLRLSNEATIASIASISRQVVTREFRPLEVHFRHGAPRTTSEHEAYFGCPILFESDRDALLVSTETLETENRLGDESISRFFETHLEAELAKFGADQRLDEQVLNQISRSLSEGVPKISDVAGHLCVSARTLQRKLADHGQSYQSLVDEARRRLSARLVAETDYSLGEIAFMTGFSDQSAFTRAFKRWEGQTPRSYRLRGRSPSG
jgi:AraC-like DNA-binding protein